MITKVSYKLRRTLPGSSYDYEELFAEDSFDETVEKRTAKECLEGCINLCISNTARARLKKEN